MGKSLQVHAKRFQLDDLCSKAKTYGAMIPDYVLTHVRDVGAGVVESINKGQAMLSDSKGIAKPLMDELDAHLEKMTEASSRLKSQVDRAAAFK